MAGELRLLFHLLYLVQSLAFEWQVSVASLPVLDVSKWYVLIALQLGDVAIVDISARRVNDDGSLGDKILSAEQKGAYLNKQVLAGLCDELVQVASGRRCFRRYHA